MNIKCSSINHKENEAIIFCKDCKIYMCKKCDSFHSELFQNHNKISLKLSKEENELFTGLCMEKSHLIEQKFFCKTHNKLCCSECITKIKGEEYGQHTDCTICPLKDIKSEKIEKLQNNIKLLDNLSLNIKDTIEEIKLINEKVEEDKDKLKSEIQNIFTKVRNLINKKEEEILLKIDNKYEALYFNKNYISEIEKLPDKINKSLEKGKIIQNDIEKYKLNSLINDCLNIENSIVKINDIHSNITKFKSTSNKKNFIINQQAFQQLFEFINTLKFIYSCDESEIINTEQFNQINEWLGGEIHSYFLKFSAKKNGCDTNIFHQNCDNTNNCLIICKPKDNDIIGGFISTKILKDDNFYDDDKAFLFNLTKKFVKKNKKSHSKAIKNFKDSSNFIKFGSDCKVLILSGNCLNDNNSYADTCGCSTNYDCDSYNLFNIGQGTHFQVENFEVFEVIKEN